MTVRIISRNAELFKNRKEAGWLLAKELGDLGGKETVALGIPRGGVIVAAEVSRLLSVELDVALSRKIGAPQNPEFAIGALSEDGRVFIDEAAAFQVGADKSYIQEITTKQLAEIAYRKEIYRKVRPKVYLKQRRVIVIDDGLATGATMQAALLSIRQEGPKSITVAVPVAPQESLEKIVGYADDVLCLRVPEYFAAVGQFYLEFTEVNDKEVLEILRRGYG